MWLRLLLILSVVLVTMATELRYQDYPDRNDWSRERSDSGSSDNGRSKSNQVSDSSGKSSSEGGSNSKSKEDSGSGSNSKEDKSWRSISKEDDGSNSNSKEHSGSDSKSKEHGGSKSKSKEDGGSHSKSKEHSGSHSKSKEHSGSHSKSNEHGGSHSKSNEHGGSHSKSKEDSGSGSNSKEDKSWRSISKEDDGSNSNSKEHSGSDSKTKEHGGSKSKSKEDGGSHSKSKEHSGSHSKSKEHSGSHSKSKEHSGSHSKSNEHGGSHSKSKEHGDWRSKSSTDSSKTGSSGNKGCGRFICPDNAVVVRQMFGIVILACKPGYKIQGPSTIRCLPSGSWSQGPTCSKTGCGPFMTPDNAVAVKQMSGIVIFACKPGYKIQGPSTIRCLPSGSWSQGPTCSKTGCGPFMTPDNAVAVKQMFGIVIFACKPGYKIQGPSTIRCLPTGSWSQGPTCSKTGCGPFMTPDNAVAVKQMFGIVIFACKPGYKIQGPSTIRCLPTGSWSQGPTCSKTGCGPFMTPDNAVAVKQMSGIVIFACKPGYKIQGPSTIRCLPSGSWSQGPTCSKTGCGPFMTPDNAVAVKQMFGTVTFVCKTGYKMQGPNTIRCQPSGSWSQGPTCSKTGCGPFMTPDNAVAVKQMYGIVIFACKPGYKIQGPSTIRCLPSGSWSQGPTCSKTGCGPFMTPDNAVAVKQMSGIVIFACKPGYKIQGPSTIRCLPSGSWSQGPTCSKTGCGPFMTPDNAVAVKQMYGIVIFACKPGYKMQGPTIIKCLPSGSWSQGPTCTKRDCGPFMTPANAVVVTNSGSGTVSFACKPGYKMQGPNIIRCLPSGSWSQGPTCTKRDCGPFMTPANAVVVTNSGSGTVSFACKPGYKMQGPNIIRCLPSGSWSQGPKCTKRDCGPFMTPENAVVVTDLGSGTVTFACKPGYKIQGPSTIRCLPAGSWSQGPTCTKTDPIRCGTFEKPDNAFVKTTSNTDNVGATVAFGCLPGYSLMGPAIITCLPSGSWSRGPRCVPVRGCGPFVTPENAIRIRTSKTNGIGAYVEFVCKDGFVMSGPGKIVCMPSGTWSQGPTCTRVTTPLTCGMFDIPLNGMVDSKNGDGEVESTVTFVCNQGYQLKGPATISCLSSGAWSKGPSCEIARCSDYTTPQNAKVNMSSGSGDVGSTVTFTCNQGYQLQGPVTITCLPSMMWSPLPTCKPIDCGDYMTPQNSEVTSSSGSGNVGSTVTFTCDQGYQMQGPSTIDCLPSGSWNKGPTCQPKGCGDYTTPQNAKVNMSSGSGDVDSTVTFTCNQGYQLQGPATITCLPSMMWSQLPTCNPIDCGDYTTPQNSEVTSSSGSGNVGSTVTFTCDQGYQMQGPSTIDCLPSGSWNKGPTCQPKVDCGSYTIPQHGSVKSSQGGTTKGAKVVFICDEDYSILGPNTIYCQSSGNWTEGPECIDERDTVVVKPPFPRHKNCNKAPRPCCVEGKITLSLGEMRKRPSVHGKLPGIEVSVQKPSGKQRKQACSASALIKVDFEKLDNNTCFGCLAGPMCGRRMLKVRLQLSDSARKGHLVHIADSETNNGNGDAGDQENDAEVVGKYPDVTIAPSDKCPNGASLTCIMSALAADTETITFYISNEHVRITNDLGLDYSLCHTCLFTLNGQADSGSAGPNEELYIGVNRLVKDLSTAGYGVCSVDINWECPWCYEGK